MSGSQPLSSARHESAAATSLPANPVQQQLLRARALTKVRSFLPSFFNPLFRKQGPVNTALIEAVGELDQKITRATGEATHHHADLERVAQGLAQDMAAMRGHVAGLNTLLRALPPGLAALDARVTHETASLAAMDHHVREELAAARKQLNDLRATWSSTLDTLNTRIASAEMAIGPHQLAIDSVTKLAEELQSTQQTALDTVRDSVTKLAEELRGTQESTANIATTVAANEAQEEQKTLALGARLEALEQKLDALAADRTLQGVMTTLGAQEQNLEIVSNRLADLESATVEQAEQQRAWSAPEEVLRRFDELRRELLKQLTESPSKSRTLVKQAIEERLTGEDEVAFSRFYLEFENQFRGSREAITTKLTRYLPVLHETCAQLGQAKAKARVLDLGCGRGEWLTLARQTGFTQASGVDSSPVMVESCRAQGVPVELGDSLEFIRAQPGGSYAFITGFHLIEHLTFKDRFSLYREVLRVLQPGGCVIFETPNPENIIVGACNFHLDPTHVRPLVPPAEEFALKSLGFTRVTIERVNPMDPDHHARTPIGEVTVRFNQFFYGAQDFALIGFKSPAA